MTNRILFTAIVFLSVANILVWSFLGVERAYANKVYPGVTIDTEPLAGLTRDQVIDRLKPIHKAMLQEKVTLKLAEQQFTPTLQELGYEVNTEAMADSALALGRGASFRQALDHILTYSKTRSIPLQYDIDQGTFDNYLNEIGKDIVKEPKDMSFEYRDGNLLLMPAADGVTLNKDELKTAIQKQVRPGQTTTVALSYGNKSPVITNESQVAKAKEQLTKLLATPLSIQAEEVSTTLSPQTIFGLLYFDIKDNELTVNINEDKVRAEITAVAKKVDIDPVAKQISAVNNDTLQEGKDGRQLNVPDATKRIMERLQNADFTSPVVLAVNKIDRTTQTISPEYQLGRYEGRYIEVDLSAQRMHLIEGQNYHKTFIISTGKWDMPTPIGEFQVRNHVPTAWSKRYGLYMDNWMAITADGAYGIHQLPRWPSGKIEGTSHLGRPVSHGCIRLGPGDATYVYDWAANGTKVFIHI